MILFHVFFSYCATMPGIEADGTRGGHPLEVLPIISGVGEI